MDIELTCVCAILMMLTGMTTAMTAVFVKTIGAQFGAGKLVGDNYRRANFYHVINHCYIVIGMAYAAVTDALTYAARLISAVQINAPFIQADTSYAERIFVVDIIGLDCLLFGIDIFGRQPAWIF